MYYMLYYNKMSIVKSSSALRGGGRAGRQEDGWSKRGAGTGRRTVGKKAHFLDKNLPTVQFSTDFNYFFFNLLVIKCSITRCCAFFETKLELKMADQKWLSKMLKWYWMWYLTYNIEYIYVKLDIHGLFETLNMNLTTKKL